MPEQNQKYIIVAQAEPGAEGAGHDTHAGTEHAGGGGGGHEAGGSPLTHHPALDFTVAGALVAAVLIALAFMSTRKLLKVPKSRLQALAEITVEGLTSFTRTSIGPGGEKFAPFIGSLFLFILFSNLVGALPLTFKREGNEVSTFLVGPMANISMTFALAFIVFIVVQVTALKSQGLKNRVSHLAGPVWWLSWLIFPLEVFGELVRPLSLSLRLFGNIFGEEMIVGVLIGLLALHTIPLPLHLPIVLFGLLTAVVQAGVFSLLSCVYLQLALDHHEEHAGGHGGEHDDHHGPASAHGAAAVPAH